MVDVMLAKSARQDKLHFATATGAPSVYVAFVCSIKFIFGVHVDSGLHWLIVAICCSFGGCIWMLTTNSSSTGLWFWLWMIAGSTSGLFLLWNFLVLPLYLTYAFRRHRLSALPSAVQDFTDRLSKSRAEQYEGYNIFFPPQSSAERRVEKSIDDTNVSVLMFYPGILVDFMAYSTILGRISDKGFVVVVINTEPTRIPLRHIGFTVDHAYHIMNDVQSCLIRRGSKVGEWVLGGHSLGTVAAAWVTVGINGSSKAPCPIRRCVFWAGMRIWKHSKLEENHPNVEFITLDGSNDPIIQRLSPRNELDLLRELAFRNPHRHVIEGGDHGGFGHYEPQKFPFHDGKRVMQREKYQDTIVELTVAFLKGSQKKIR